MPIDNLIATLQTICDVVFEQGSLAPETPYPARFFTFWNNDTADHKHYDNKAHGYVWEIDVNSYSTDPADVYAMQEQARTALLAAGWKIGGKGHAVMSDDPTHTGRGFTARFIET